MTGIRVRMTRSRNFRAGSLLLILGMLIGRSDASPQNVAVLPISRMTEPWWRQRFDEKRDELRGQPVNLIWLGDSITQDWERDGTQPWLRFAPVWHRFYGDRHAVNLGFKGDSTCHLLWRLRHGELDGIAPRVAIVLIGANNFGHIHTDASETEAGIGMVLDEIHRRTPQTHVLLLAVLPSIRSRWVSENTTRLNAALSRDVEVGRPYVTFRDVGYLVMRNGQVDASAFLDPRLVPPDPPLPPTSQTQAAIAAAIESDVAHMLGDRIHS